MDQHLNEQVFRTCIEFNQSPPLVFALIKASSHWNRYLSQYLPTSTQFVDRGRPGACTLDTEIVHQRTRWGLLMLPGHEIRKLTGAGFWLSELHEPFANIYWGVKWLAHLSLQHRDPVELIKAFHGQDAKENNFLSKVFRYEHAYADAPVEGDGTVEGDPAEGSSVLRFVWEAALKQKCMEYGVDFKMAHAIIEVTSGWDPNFAHFSPNYNRSNLGLKRPSECTSDTEFIQQRTRWGLFGLYGHEARRSHFGGWLSSLLVPEVNIEVGLTHLAKLALSYRGDALISAFNSNFPRRERDHFVNQAFVDAVREKMRDVSE